jgi:hypothetical protein
MPVEERFIQRAVMLMGNPYGVKSLGDIPWKILSSGGLNDLTEGILGLFGLTPPREPTAVACEHKG